MDAALRIFGYLMVAAVWLLLGLVACALLGLMLFPMGWWLIPAVVIITVHHGWWVRRRRSALVLSYLEQIVRMNLPLTSMLAAAERGETGKIRQGLGELRWRLEAGETLGAAAEVSLKTLPRRARSLIAIAERIGQLPAMLRHLARRDRHVQRRATPDAAATLGYGASIIVAGGVVALWSVVFLGPRLAYIFEDHDLPLPRATQALFAVSSWFVGTMPGQVVPGLFILLAVILMLVIVMILVARFPSVRHLVQEPLWRLPAVGALLRDRPLADACRLIASALHAGMPLQDALREAGSVRGNGPLRRRMQRWGEGVAAGQPSAQAVRRAGLPSLMAEMAGHAERTGSLPACLDFLARYYEDRHQRGRAAALAVAKPVIVLACAAPVGFIVYAMFRPLVTLIEAGTRQSGLM